MDEQDDVVATVAVDTRGYEGSGVPVDLEDLDAAREDGSGRR
jgi:hypothetical protein